MRRLRASCHIPLLAACASPLWAAAADWQPSATLVAIYQTTNQSQIDSETAVSANLFLRRRVDADEWLVHVEGATTPTDSGVSSQVPEANAIVGGALDMNGWGRVQLSELYHTRTPQAGQVFSIGYLDISSFFEQSRIASDETSQFMGASFTGNPTIEFPDYTLGAVFEQTVQDGPVLRLGLTSSNGLANNPDRSYSHLLSVGNEGKGVFAVSSASWKNTAWLLRVGIWANTADHEAIDGSGRGLRNNGSYLLAGYRQRRHALNFRFGVANEKVSRASAFTSLGYQFRLDQYVLGAGAAHAFLSSREPDASMGDTQHYEIYLRRDLSRRVFLTGDIQHVVSTNFGSSAALRGQGITIYGLRLTWLYE